MVSEPFPTTPNFFSNHQSVAMEEQTKLLADLMAVISSMNAKLDGMLPVVHELNQCRPADAPSSSPKPASASMPASTVAAISYSDHHDASHAVPGDAASSAIVDEVPATTCSELGQDNPFQTRGVTTVALLHEGVPGLAAEPAALHCLPSPANSGKETLDMDQSAPTGFISTAPMTCSTHCLPQLAIAVPVLDAPSSSTPTKDGLKTNSIPVAVVPPALTGVLSVVLSLPLYSDHEPVWPSSSQRISSMVLVHRPRPWPSFVGDHAAGDETRPLPWPAFKGIADCESSSDAIMKPYQILDYFGNLCTSAGYILVHDMLIPGELRCLHEVLWFPQYWWSTSEWRCLNDVLWYFDCWRSTTCMQPAHTPISLLCTISGFQLLVMVRSLELKFVSNCSPTFMIVLLDSGAALSSESIVVDTTGCVRSLLSAISSVAGYPEFAVQSPIHYSIASESSSWLLSSIGWMLFARIQSGQNESHILLLPWVLEQEELILEFQFQQSSTMPDWCLRNQSITATGRLYYSLKYKNLAATWRSMFLCVRFLVQLEATCSVQTNWLLTHVCQLTSEPSEESCCCALISLSLHITIQVAYLLQWSTRALVDSESRVYVGVEPVCAAFHAFALLECHPGEIFQSDHGPRCGQRLSSTAACWCALSFHGKKLQDGYVYENLQFAYSASDQGALLFLIQSTALKYVELRWFTSASLLEILSTCTTGFSRQLYANYSVQSNSQLTDEYPPSVFGPELWIQLDYKDCRATRCTLLVANSTMLIFMVVYCGGQETFQGGRHTPGLHRHMMLRLPWDPGKLLQAQAFCDSGSELPLQFKQVPTGYKYYLDDAFASYHLSAFFDVVSVRHDMYFHLVAFYPNSGSYYDSSNIKDHRLQWDPGRFKVKSAWGQAEFQGGRGVRNPSSIARWAGTWAVVMGLTRYQPPVGREQSYKYRRRCNGKAIRKDHERTALFLAPCFSVFPILASLFFPNPC